MLPRSIVLCLLALCALPAAARATALMGQTAGDPKSSTSPDSKYVVSLNVSPITSLDGPTAAEQKQLTALGSKNWTFTYGGGAGTGDFNFLQYGTFALKNGGGANFSVLYDDGVEAPRTDYEWVQFAYPTNWGPFGNTPNIDSTPRNNKNSPFYDAITITSLPKDTTSSFSLYANSGAIWQDKTNYPKQNIQNPAGGGKVPAGDLILLDQPYCSYTCVKDGNPASITFDTYLVTFTAPTKKQPGNITFLDGFHWGLQIACAPPSPAPNGPCAACQCLLPVPEPPAWPFLLLSSVGLAILKTRHSV